MKVLLIDVNCKNSSTGRIVYDLYTNLRASGDEAAVCYGRGENISEENIFKFGLDWETKIHALLTRLTGYTGCFSFFSTRRLLRFIKDFRPDVVHIHELHAYFVNIKPLLTYLKKQGIPTVCTLHCEFMYTGKCGHAMECEQWKTQCEKCPRLKEYPKTLVFDRTKHMFLQKKTLYEGYANMTITAPSSWLMDRAKESILADKPGVVIPNGIDTEVFRPRDTASLRRQHGIKNEKIIIHVTADFSTDPNHLKGGYYVVALARRLLEMGSDTKVIVVGKYCQDIVMPENMIMLGRITDKTLLAEYYAMADVTLLTSKKETFSMICAESLCCGTPIVGFRAGAPEQIALPEFSSFVDYADEDALYCELVKALQKGKTLDIAKQAKQKYDICCVTDAFIRLYEDMRSRSE